VRGHVVVDPFFQLQAIMSRRTVLSHGGAKILLVISLLCNVYLISLLNESSLEDVAIAVRTDKTDDKRYALRERNNNNNNTTTPFEFDDDKKIIVNVGMPRTGTHSWINMLKILYPTSYELHHQIYDYEAQDLAELLLLGKRTNPTNPLYQKLTLPPSSFSSGSSSSNGSSRSAVRAMADHPAFLLAPIAKDFPHVYWIQVTRELESHVNSTLYMLNTWCQDRCVCNTAPRCSKGSIALIDRLYFDKNRVLELMCENNGNANLIPRDVIRTWLRRYEEETEAYLRDHPRFLRLRLEDGSRENMKRMVQFLGLNESVLDLLDYESFHLKSRKGNRGSQVTYLN